jgi:hypothetical protein
MRRFCFLMVLLLAGCGGVVPIQGALTDSSPVETATQTPLPATQAPDGLTAEPARVLFTQSGDLQVTLFSGTEAETNQQPYLLKGEAPAGAVVTVNEQILVVDKSGVFNVEVPLGEGPNLVEVIASNAAGDVAEFLLTIYFNP